MASTMPSSPMPIQRANGAAMAPVGNPNLLNGHGSPALSSSQDRDEDGLGPIGITGSSGGLGARRPSQHARAKSGVFGDALDLAEPGNRLGSSPDVQSRLDAKRVEFEQQLDAQKKVFEQQMQELIEKQAREAIDLLKKSQARAAAGMPPNSAPLKRAPSASMPASPPSGPPSDSGSGADETKANGAPARSKSGDDLPGFGRGGRFGKNRLSALNGSSFTARDAHSVPTTRRHSGDETLADTVAAVGALSIDRQASKDGGDNPMLTSFLFDDELEADLNSTTFASKYLHNNVDDDKFPILVSRKDYPGQLSASSAALDLAPLSQTPPRSGSRIHDAGRGSEWPQFEPPKHLGQPTDFGANGKVSPTSPGLDRSSSPTVSRTLPAPASPTTELTSPVKRSSFDPTEPGQDGAAPPLQRMNSTELANAMAQFVLPPGVSSAFNSSAGPADPYRGYDLSTSGMYQMAPGKQMNAGLIEPQNRFAGLRLEDLVGDMQNLCRDQHGCRFLQRKLEEGDPHHRDLIFIEIAPIFTVLVVDPFANYLAQRMLECATDEQRDRLVEGVSSDIGAIAVNMHGTRAIQKMIDYLSTQYQVATVIGALSANVIGLIKDLNGNHVVQKCLNHFTPDDCQFIYNAVTNNLVEVATHRHGCCVLQRAIDHASEPQRIQLVTEITYQSLALVQDAFGNYVVQYILDIDPRFADAVVRQFLGNVPALSCQKFSSNVVEKCIRVSDASSRKLLVEELLERSRLERLLNDAFGNYVLQTALDFAEGVQRQTLVTFLRPMLPSIRNTPHGKRLTQKIQRDTRLDGMRSGPFHPNSGPTHLNPMAAFGQPHMSPYGAAPSGPYAGFPAQSRAYGGAPMPMPAMQGGGMGAPSNGYAQPPHMAFQQSFDQAPYGPNFFMPGGGGSMNAGAVDFAPAFAAYQ